LQKIFKIQDGKSKSDTRPMYFGIDCETNKEYSIVVEDSWNYLKGAKDDAELVCELLNLYYNGLIKIDWDMPLKGDENIAKD